MASGPAEIGGTDAGPAIEWVENIEDGTKKVPVVRDADFKAYVPAIFSTWTYPFPDGPKFVLTLQSFEAKEIFHKVDKKSNAVTGKAAQMEIRDLASITMSLQGMKALRSEIDRAIQTFETTADPANKP